MIAAKLLVTTTRFTEGALFLMALRIPVVPMMAGESQSSMRWSGAHMYRDLGDLSWCR